MQKLTLLTTVCYPHALFLLACQNAGVRLHITSVPVPAARVHQATIMQATAHTHRASGSPRADSQILRPYKQQYLTSSALSSGNNYRLYHG